MRGSKFGLIYDTNSNASLEEENQVGHGLKHHSRSIIIEMLAVTTVITLRMMITTVATTTK